MKSLLVLLLVGYVLCELTATVETATTVRAVKGSRENRGLAAMPTKVSNKVIADRIRARAADPKMQAQLKEQQTAQIPNAALKREIEKRRAAAGLPPLTVAAAATATATLAAAPSATNVATPVAEPIPMTTPTPVADGTPAENREVTAHRGRWHTITPTASPVPKL
ncbi:hypothetical protein PAPYR_3752 [Paratrimastix pyriformis]|uniref:Uncharacterized protein n=1 Tax=Paratrimastix pyriformis TaxID=342808 RepID=A0ABQ8UQP9_9EUKA|nr:hypothetical protein PAPYR_3752 [Paratrimastix pyriformis]|eukprot:GAFH01005547.1.p2 GENE.GAFH01005547.1~~GAFH01005547.1.p2  ORF type:complete len:166 (+),score=14.48 GAFH01005547.1:109-606(+)